LKEGFERQEFGLFPVGATFRSKAAK